MKLLIATRNAGKVREYQEMLHAGDDLEIVGLEAVGLGAMDVEETGTSFSENASLKARAYGAASGLLTLADDSGLVVNALDGRPGIHSARYGQPGLDDAGRRAYLLREMAAIPDNARRAHFTCVIAVYDPGRNVLELVEGRCNGRILREERDAGQGFGYDALFLPNGYNQSFGEMPAALKNRISHRGRAVAQLPALLARLRAAL